jgi:hypothetical protein
MDEGTLTAPISYVREPSTIGGERLLNPSRVAPHRRPSNDIRRATQVPTRRRVRLERTKRRESRLYGRIKVQEEVAPLR